MQSYIWNELSAEERRDVLARPVQRLDKEVRATVEQIFADIANGGRAAVNQWAEELDGVSCKIVKINSGLRDAAIKKIGPQAWDSIQFAKANIERFHRGEPVPDYTVEVDDGLTCSRVHKPLQVAGLYVPGGTAPLFSTLLMLAVPAILAGVRDIIVCTPPDPDGELHPAIAAAAAACGIEKVFLVGGVQAIAAMALGVAGMPRADIIAGPGNSYVTEAKRFANNMSGGPKIDMPAGPSELLVIADETADPELVAADLVSQAEHDKDAQVLLISTSKEVVNKVNSAVQEQIARLPRQNIAAASLACARTILVGNISDAVMVSNHYAPEHLSLNVREPEALLADIEAAGTVFVGGLAAETFGDYVAGPSHVLPTDGNARNWSGVSVATFMRSMTVQRVTQAGAKVMIPHASRLAKLEGLEAHARAADIRAKLVKAGMS